MGSTFLAAGAVNVLQLKEQKLKKEIGTAVTIGNLALGGFLLYRGLKKD